MSTLGWRKDKCKRGHKRNPNNLTANGTCKTCMKAVGKNWRCENIERSREINRNSESKRNSTEEGKERMKRYNHQRVLDPRLSLLYAAKRRAKAEGITFDLSVNDVVIPEVCPVLGIELFKGTRHNREHSPSIDRFLPVLGYTKRNIRVISWRANDLKKNATVEELTKVLSYMKGENA